VDRDSIGIFAEGCQTDRLTIGIDQRHVERRCGRRYRRSLLERPSSA
jgi:hypothetical protein